MSQDTNAYAQDKVKEAEVGEEASVQGVRKKE